MAIQMPAKQKPVDPGPNASREDRINYARARAYYEGQDIGRAAEMEATKLNREEDLAAGRKRGAEEFGDGSLGRVDEGRSKDIADIIERRKAESNGFSDEEQNAFREKNQVDLNQSLAGKMRALKVAQAQSGVRGGLATAQQASAVKDANAANVANERELFLKNIDARRQGLANYETSVGGAEKGELERTMYNQGQVNKEKLGRLGTEFGYGSLGSGERAALFQKWAGEDQAKATKEAAKESGGGLCSIIFFISIYGAGSIDAHARTFRDQQMSINEKRGYYKTSEFLVPLMEKSSFVRFAVKTTMTDPMMTYGRCYYGKGSKIGLACKPVVGLWMRFFNLVSGNKPFIRKNGEVI